MKTEHQKLKECILKLNDLNQLVQTGAIDEKSAIPNEIMLNYEIYTNDWFALKCDSKNHFLEAKPLSDFVKYFNLAVGLKYKFFVASVFFKMFWLYKTLLNIRLKYPKNFLTSGKRYFCPCCGAKFGRFLDFDFRNTKYNPLIYKKFYAKTICPECNSLPRHRILAYFIENHTEMFQNKKVLVTGMSPQEYILFKRLNIKVENSDIYDGANFKWDIQNIPCADDQYDVIICNHVLEHVKDYKKALKELHRILKPAGTLLISVPTLYKYDDTFEDFNADNPTKRKIYYGQDDHLRIFGKNFAEYLSAAGFTVNIADGKKMPRKIRPVTGPASYDDKVIYLAKK